MFVSSRKSNDVMEVSTITKDELWDGNEGTIPTTALSVFDVGLLKTNSPSPSITEKNESHHEKHDCKQVIDNTPISKVSEIRKIFCNNSKPLFPKSDSLNSLLLKQQNSKSDSSLYEKSLIESPCHTPNITLTDLQNETLASPEMSPTTLPNPSDTPNPLTKLSSEEFQDLVERKGCVDAVKCFSYPLCISVIVKSFTASDDNFHVIKNINLQFHMKKRLVIMNRGKLSRYISLDKMYKIHTHANPVDGIHKLINKLSWINKKHYLVALYFHATPYPIYFVFKDIATRDLFGQLIIFLHENSTLASPLEIVE